AHRRIQALSPEDLARGHSEHHGCWRGESRTLSLRHTADHDPGSRAQVLVRGQGQGRPRQPESARMGGADVEVSTAAAAGQTRRKVATDGAYFQARAVSRGEAAFIPGPRSHSPRAAS